MAASGNPRLVALRSVAAVLDGRSLDAVLPQYSQALGAADRGLARELAFGLCRWYRQLHALVAARLRKPLKEKDRDIHLAMLLGLYQLMHTRIPPHAAISATVELARLLHKPWAVKLINGVLRGLQRDLADPASVLHAQIEGDLSIRYAQPKWFVRAMQQAWPDRHEAILEALQRRAPMTLRLNLRRIAKSQYLERLRQADLAGEPLELVPEAVVLKDPVAVEALPGFCEGLVSVQDAGAQLAATLLDVRDGQRILDACAAPGGKTGHILELADDLDVTAMDADADRLARVRENLDRLGLPAQLLAGDAAQPPAAWRDRPFDRILVDAPCSATGVMRRHPDIRLLRRHADIAALAERQAAILDALWPCLRPGGRLLYATCSLMPAENEEQVTWFLERHADARNIELTGTWGHPRSVGRQTLPGEHTMDGFYYALVEKKQE